MKVYTSKADPAPAHRARAPPFEIFYGCIFGNFDSMTRTNLIVINIQCLQCVFYSVLSIQKHICICKGASKQSPGLKNYTPSILKFLDPPLDREHMESYRSTAISLADITASGYIRPRPIRSSSSFGRLM